MTFENPTSFLLRNKSNDNNNNNNNNNNKNNNNNNNNNKPMDNTYMISILKGVGV